MDVRKLLERIEFTAPVETPNINLLNELCLAYVSNVPFDTIDLFGQEKKVLDLRIIYNRIVNQHRGGFCFELNALFEWMLHEIGFNVEKYQGYPFLRETGAFREIADHSALVVSLRNGERWLTDVGWGGSSFTLPLRLDLLDAEQPQPNGIYRLRKMDEMLSVQKKTQKYIKHEDEESIKFESKEDESFVRELGDEGQNPDWTPIYGFKQEPCRHLGDFQEGFDFAQNLEFFISNPIAVLQNKTGRKFLFGDRYVEKKYVDPDTIELVSAQRCTEEEIHDILKREFGIVINRDLKFKVQK